MPAAVMLMAVMIAVAQPVPVGANAAGDADEGRRQLFIWAPILVLLILLAFGAYSLFTRWMKSSPVDEGGGGFSLSDLRAMHKAGKISTEEFEMTRAKMVAAAKKMVESVPGIKPKNPGKPGPRRPAISDDDESPGGPEVE